MLSSRAKNSTPLTPIISGATTIQTSAIVRPVRSPFSQNMADLAFSASGALAISAAVIAPRNELRAMPTSSSEAVDLLARP